MKLLKSATSAAGVLFLGACAAVSYGDKESEARLRALQPIAGKTSLYACRETAAFSGAGNRTTVIVNGRAIGTLKPNNFAHTTVEAGLQDIYLRLNPGGDSGILTLRTQPGEVAIVWVGVTGAGFGTLTVDNFSSRSAAERCVKGAAYAVPAETSTVR
jgi:hypothetical protein